MKNIRKSFLAVMMLASCLTVSACGETTTTETRTREVPAFPTTNLPDIIDVKGEEPAVESITFDRDTVALYTDETYQIDISFSPRRKEAPKCVYTSSDTNVATVDEKGLIKAIGPGVADVSINVDDGKVKENVKVYVYNDGLNQVKRNSVIGKILNAENKGSGFSKVSLKEYVEQNTYENDNVTSSIKEYTTLTASIEDAYFMVDEFDVEAKTEGGSLTYEHFKYIFYTNEDYDTYIYKVSGETKNYMVVSTTSFIGVGTRFDALSAVLGNFFTSGSAIMTNVLEYPVGGYNNKGQSVIQELNADKLGVNHCGSNSDDSLYFIREDSYTNQRSDADWEKNWGIPADARFDIDIIESYNFVENYVANFSVLQGVYWTGNDIRHGTVFQKKDSVKTSNVQLEYPNKADFIKVADIFEL